jgi:hypothetical protein
VLFPKDRLLKEEILKAPKTSHGLSWKIIAKNLGGMKSVISCRNRWKKLQETDAILQENGSNDNEMHQKSPPSSLRPASQQSSHGIQKSGPWSPEEDQMLAEIMRSNHGNSLSFSRVAEAMNYTRTPIQCQYRWKIIGSEARKSSPPTPASSSSPSMTAPMPSPIEEIISLKKISRWSESEVGRSHSPSPPPHPLFDLPSPSLLHFQIHDLLLAVDQSVGTNSRINWVTVWSRMERKRSVDDYRKKYRSVLLPQLKKNRLETRLTSGGGHQSLEYSLDEELEAGERDQIRKDFKKLLKKPSPPVKKRENHYWTEAEVLYLTPSPFPHPLPSLCPR